MIDKCPTCGAHRGELSPMVCYHDWHNTMTYKPELMFAFRVPSSEYSKTVSETQLRASIKHVYAHYSGYSDVTLVALAAERMIEMAKTPAPDHLKVRLGRTPGSVRDELEDMLLMNNLDPGKYLKSGAGSVHYTKEPSSMCQPEPTSKGEAERASTHLAKMLHDDLGVSVTPIILRLWLIERWDDVAKLAHKIHAYK